MSKGARSFPLLVIFLLMGMACVQPAWAQGPTPGQNVNMVSGTQWPGGDPFLQRQNEPSIAVSSRNPQHLLAGANDYRTVDLNFFATGETGDAWLGVFKSFDGGATWQSTLFPGYPLDQTPEGLSSPLKTPTQFNAASDPVVRAGTNGLFFYSGIAFNRTRNSGVVFVSRFMDLNNKENGTATTTTINSNTDPIRYISTAVLDSGNAGQFLDKPWIAVDIPRGTAVCTVNVPEPGAPSGVVTQTIPAGNVYMAWSDFVGNSLVRTKIYFSRSTDCGATWSNPTKLSEGYPLNQGVTIAVDPATGNVYVAWRTVAAANTPDGINVAKSINGGQSFLSAVQFMSLPSFNPSSPVATPSFFDENTLTMTAGGPEMRTTAFPSMAIDGCGQIYVAWSQRDPQSSGDARIVMSTSMDGVSWTAPFRVDNTPISDDYSNSFTRGNQFMPSLTFAAGKLMVLYYDLHLDHTLGAFAPAYSFSPDGFPVPDAKGRLVLEQRIGIPETAPIFGPFINDAGLTAMRHVLDVRVAQFSPVALGGSCPSGSVNFATARVSQYRFGTTGLNQSSTVQQLEANPPNLPIFEGGLAPFVGDYVDIAGSAISPSGNSWVFNTAPAPAPVHIATWTDNRDVQPPLPNAQGVVDWTKYTPVLALAGQSVFDPTQPRPQCDPAAPATASRNQNIYSSRITQGLVVASPQTSKPLNTTLQRAFVILVQNFTQAEKSFRLSIPNQPLLANGTLDPSGFASVVATVNPPPAPPFSPTTQLDVTVGPHNGITRPVFALSGNPTARITINVQEITAPMGSVVNNGLSSFIVLNADGTVPGLIDPDGAPAGTTIVGVEVYNPNVSSPNVSSPNVSSPNVSSPNVSSPNVSSPNVSSPNVSSQSFANTPVAGLAVPNVSSPNVSSPNVSSPNVSSPNVSSPNVSSTSLTTSAPISDANYAVTNNGNTYASYHVAVVSAQPMTSPLQLLINKIYATPVAVGCSLGLQQANVLLSDVNNPPIQSAATFTPTDPATDPTQAKNANVNNSTFTLAPGEQGLITLRGPMTIDTLTAITKGQLAPVVTSQAANTNTNIVPFSFPGGASPGGGIFMFSSLPDAITGVPYNAQVQTFGGTPPLAFSVTGGSLPFAQGGGNLQINPATGVIAGNPGCPANVFCIFPTTFQFTLNVTDSAGHAASQASSIHVSRPLAVLTSTLPPGVQNSNYLNTLSSFGGFPPITWQVAGLPSGLASGSNGIISGAPTSSGAFNVQINASDSSTSAQTATVTLPLTVFANLGFVTFVQQPTVTAAGAAIAPAVTVQLIDAAGGVVPGVPVTIAIGNNPSGGTLSGTTTVISDAVGVATFANLSIDTAGTGYTLVASAKGAGGAASNAFSIFLAPPTALTVALSPPGSVTLNWNPSVSPVAGYNVYRSTVSGSAYTKLSTVNALSFIDSTVASGTTYFYVVTALSLGNVESAFSNEASAPVPSPSVIQVAAGGFHTCALLNNGRVKCWGNNGLGQLGNGTTTDSSTPVVVTGGSGVTAIAAGGIHTCALLFGGTVQCWGKNQYGELGNGTTIDSSTPVAVTGLSGVTAITAGYYHTCALISEGTVECWGWNNVAQLGIPTTTANSSTPVTVTGLSGATAITAGVYHNCALLSGGTEQCWGNNPYGGLGNGTTINSSTPVAVTGLSGAAAIAAGYNDSCALLSSGTVQCWGLNFIGELGNGTTTDSSTPVAVSGLSGVTAIAAGFQHTCALFSDGTVECWGVNFSGQLGNGTTVNSSSTPVAVSGLSGVTAIAAENGDHTCALTSPSTVQCWGNNQNGQLGIPNTTASSNIPVMVTGLP